MVAKNDITGDSIKTKVNSKAYSDNYDRIFGKKQKNTTSDFQDILSTEDCVLDALEKEHREKALDEIVRVSQELGLYDEEFNEQKTP